MLFDRLASDDDVIDIARYTVNSLQDALHHSLKYTGAEATPKGSLLYLD